MHPSLRFGTLLICLALALAVIVGGPGTGALLSDTHTAAGNVSADVDDAVSTVRAINEPDNSSNTTITDTVTNETDTNTTDMNETTGTDDASTDAGDDGNDEDA